MSKFSGAAMALVVAMSAAGCATEISDAMTTAGVRPFDVKYGEINLVVLLDPEGKAEDKDPDLWAGLDDGQKIDRAFQQYHEEMDSKTPERQATSRNQIQERLLGASNQRCHQYQQYMQNVHSGANFWLGFLTTAAGAAGALVTGGTSQILSGAAAGLSGTRAEFNQDYFYDVTVATIFDGIASKRESSYTAIKKMREHDTVRDYTVESAVKDAITYHSQCSLVVGVQELGDSVKLARDPGLDAIARALMKMNIAKKIVENKSTDPADLLGPDNTSANPAGLLGLGGRTVSPDVEDDPSAALGALLLAVPKTTSEVINHLAELKYWPDTATRDAAKDAVTQRATKASGQLLKCQAKIVTATSKIADSRVKLAAATKDPERGLEQAALDASILEGRARTSELAPAHAWLKADMAAFSQALDSAETAAGAQVEKEKKIMDKEIISKATKALNDSSLASADLLCAAK